MHYLKIAYEMDFPNTYDQKINVWIYFTSID